MLSGGRSRSALLGVAYAALVTLLSALMLSLGVSSLQHVAPRVGRSLWAIALVELTVYLGFSVLIARAAAERLPRSAWLGLVRAEPRALAAATLLGVCLHGPADYVEAGMERLFPLPESVLSERAARLAPDALSERVLLFVFIALAVPLVEELFFRGALFRALERASSSETAALVTSVCFTLSHGEVRSWPALMLVATLLGVLRLATGSLYPGVLLHAAFNATTLLVMYAQGHASPVHSPWPLGAALGALLSVALLASLRKSPRIEGGNS